VPGAELADQLEGLAGVGDVVGDQHPRAGQVDLVEVGRQDHRQLQALVDPGVELHVHHEEVLHVQRVAQRPTEEQPAAGDGQDQVRLEPVVGHLLGQLAGGAPEVLVRQRLALGGHGPDRLSSRPAQQKPGVPSQAISAGGTSSRSTVPSISP
jgi:hypothetical protein